jgi:hypothetical protein
MMAEHAEFSTHIKHKRLTFPIRGPKMGETRPTPFIAVLFLVEMRPQHTVKRGVWIIPLQLMHVDRS